VKSAPKELSRAPHSSEALLCLALTTLSGYTPRVVSLHRFPALAVSVPADQYRGSQLTKNTFSGESCCLPKNATKIPR